MTRKRYIKLLMGYGVSRNRARQLADTLIAIKEETDKIRHFEKCGDIKCGDVLKQASIHRVKRLRCIHDHIWEMASLEMLRFKLKRKV